MGAGILSTSLVEGAPFDTVRDVWAQVTARTVVNGATPKAAKEPAPAPPTVVPLPQSNDPAELRKAVTAAAARFDFVRITPFHGGGPEYVMLGTAERMITAVALPQARPDVISGVFTGCLMGVFRSEGVVYVCHVATSTNPGDDCRARWRRMTGDDRDIDAAYYFKPSLAGDLVTAADRQLATEAGGGTEYWGVVPGDDLEHPFVVVTVRTCGPIPFVLSRIDVPAQASGADALGLHWRGDGDY